MDLYVKAESPEFMPSRKHPDDAAFDLVVAEEVRIPVGEIRDVSSGCAIELPVHTWALILGRSSTSRTHRLLVHPGVIDGGYRGPLFAQVENIGQVDFVATVGMRLGQLIPLPNLAGLMEIFAVDRLSNSQRGSAGFGSTGI